MLATRWCIASRVTLLRWLLWGIAALLVGGSAAAGEAGSPLAFVGVNVVDVSSGDVRRNATVLIEGQRITRIADRGDRTPLPPRTRQIRAEGKFLIPGLWDMHVHSFLGERDPDWMDPLFIVNGVTGVRDMGTFVPLTRVRRLRDQILAGERVGPRMVIAGPLVNGFNSVWNDPGGVPDRRELARALQTLKSQGADFIKIYALMTPETYAHIIEEARRLDLPVSGQVPETIAASEAADSGQRSIEHLDKIVLGCSSIEPEILSIKEDILRSMPMRADEGFLNQLYPTPEEIAQMLGSMDADRCEQLLQRLAKTHTAIVPTLVLSHMYSERHNAARDERIKYVPQPIRQAWGVTDEQIHRGLRDHQSLIDTLDQVSRQLLRPMYHVGVPLLAGTHTAAVTPFIYPGFSLHDELLAMSRAGVRAIDILRSATIEPARAIGRESTLGSIAAGKLADLVLLDANPLDDIANTQRIRAVVANGRLFDRAALDRLLREAAERAR